jgi:glyoxylate utilization-related uncharacterized protein
MAGQLSNPRVVRTTHKEDGTSIIAADEIREPHRPFGPTATGFTVLDARSSVPITNTDSYGDYAASLPRCPPAGVTFSIVDLPGNGYSSPVHRTLTTDYGVVLSGEIVLELDGGEEKTIHAGEFIIQQGTNHKWTNRTSEPCRIMWVMVGANTVTLADGTKLEETVFKK